MNIEQLIARLERLKQERGNIRVRISAVAEGLDFMDEDGNRISRHTISAPARECVVDDTETEKGKYVWILGTSD